jgi:hypothetical protein
MMRVHIAAIAIALSVLVARPASAQWTLGAGAGLTLASLSGDVVLSSGTRTGFTAGASAEYAMDGPWALGLEANYVQRGGNSVRFVALASTEFFNLHVDYLEIPVLIKAVIPTSDRWTVRVYGGLGLSFELSCKISEAGSSNEACGTTALGLDTQNTEWSVPFGATFSYKLSGGSNLGVDLRYVLGVSSVLEAVDAKNRTFEIIARWFSGN